MVFGIGRAIKGKEIKQPTTFETLPEFAQTAIEDLVSRAGILSQQPISALNLAPLTPGGQRPSSGLPLSQAAARGINVDPSRGAFEFGKRGGLRFAQAGDILGRSPELVDLAQQFTRGVTPDIARLREGIGGEEIRRGIGQFLDPFQEQVIAPALRDLREQFGGAISDIGAGATQAGAFGGQRQALLESEAARNLAREAGRLSGGLRSQAFESAAGRTLQNLLEGRQRFGQAAQLGLGQAGQALAGAGTLGQIGGQLGGLGTELLRARQAIGNVRAQERLTPIQAAQLASQAQLGQAAVQQEPLRFLQQTLGAVPQGGGGISRQQGILPSLLGAGFQKGLDEIDFSNFSFPRLG
jgi:hypothetical protein